MSFQFSFIDDFVSTAPACFCGSDGRPIDDNGHHHHQHCYRHWSDIHAHTHEVCPHSMLRTPFIASSMMTTTTTTKNGTFHYSMSLFNCEKIDKNRNIIERRTTIHIHIHTRMYTRITVMQKFWSSDVSLNRQQRLSIFLSTYTVHYIRIITQKLVHKKARSLHSHDYWKHFIQRLFDRKKYIFENLMPSSSFLWFLFTCKKFISWHRSVKCFGVYVSVASKTKTFFGSSSIISLFLNFSVIP